MEVLGDDISMLDAYAAANDVLHGAVSGIAEVINNPGSSTSTSPTCAP
jgi:cell division protein FtsZ